MNPLDKKAKCPKCDHDKVNIWYDDVVDITSPCFLECKVEHFDRRCLLCGYAWREGVPKKSKVVVK